MKPAIHAVTARIRRERSAPLRRAYLERVAHLIDRPRGAERMGCSNVAHAFAALPPADKLRVVAERAPNIGVVTAHNDMLSAHQPYEVFPAAIGDEARRYGATAPVAAGCRRCATASRKGCRAWSCRCSRATRSRWARRSR